MNSLRLSDFFTFEKTLSLSLLRLVYVFGLIGIGIMVIVTIFGGLSAMRYSATAGLGSIMLALLGGVVGTLLWRVTCELWMVIFGIYDRLGQIQMGLNAASGKQP